MILCRQLFDTETKRADLFLIDRTQNLVVIFCVLGELT